MKNLLKLTKIGLISGAVALASSAQAQIAGHNVILIHGFQFGDLSSKPSDQEVMTRPLMPEFWRNRAEASIGWSSAERIEGRIAEQVYVQAVDIAQRGLCDQGCVVVTHSTGEIVNRYFLDNQEAWLRSAGLEPLNIVAKLDFAGAGGGTELASLAVDVATNASIPDWIKQAVSGVFGLDLSQADISDLGVVQDLDVSKARNIATSPSDIPSLRFSGSGGNFIVKGLIPAADDGTVPAHSSCGASSPAPIDSCSNWVSYSGKQTGVNGPNGLYYNHYPLLMSEKADHGQVIHDEAKGDVTFVFNNFNAGLNVDFNTYTKNVPWWQFWRETGTFQFVSGSADKSVSALVYQTLNN